MLHFDEISNTENLDSLATSPKCISFDAKATKKIIIEKRKGDHLPPSHDI